MMEKQRSNTVETIVWVLLLALTCISFLTVESFPVGAAVAAVVATLIAMVKCFMIIWSFIELRPAHGKEFWLFVLWMVLTFIVMMVGLFTVVDIGL